MLKKVDGKWAIVSKSTEKVLVYYKGEGKPSEEWIKKQERRIQFYKHKGENKLKTFDEFAEGIKKWKDIKNPKVKREASQMLKALDVGEVLGYSLEHGEFSIFEDEKEWAAAQKGSKGKAMKWVKVESWVRELEGLDEAYQKGFDFKAAVKIGMLQKDDEEEIISMKKMGWEIEEFILTSKGFELTMKNKAGKEIEFTDKRPDYVLKQAEKKIKKKRGKF